MKPVSVLTRTPPCCSPRIVAPIAVDVIHFLMDISGQLDAGADKDRDGGRVPRPLLRCIEVGRVGIGIAGQDRQGRAGPERK